MGKLERNPAEPVEAGARRLPSAGSFLGAAAELNRTGVPSRRGKWADQTVARILRREGLIEASDRGGHRYAPVEHYLAGLLACPHCYRS